MNQKEDTYRSAAKLCDKIREAYDALKDVDLLTFFDDHWRYERSRCRQALIDALKMLTDKEAER